MSYHEDRSDIIDLGTRMMWAVDTRDWALLASVFAGTVTMDFTRLWGGRPQVQTPAEVAEAWSGLFAGFDATQHLLANHLVAVDGDSATLTCVFQATHRRDDPLGSPLWTLGGTYRITAVRAGRAWRITHVEMTPTWAEGNKDVVLAATRN